MIFRLTRFFRELFLHRHTVENDEYETRDPQVMTYIYGGGISEGEWITHWTERDAG